jgi:hypothetical protein
MCSSISSSPKIEVKPSSLEKESFEELEEDIFQVLK